MNALKILTIVLIHAWIVGCATAPGTNQILQPEVPKNIKTQLAGMTLKNASICINPVAVQHDTVYPAEKVLQKKEVTKEKEEAWQISMKALKEEFSGVGFKVVDVPYSGYTIAVDI